jgi:DNA-binding response OmpR family regulator
MDMLRGEVMAQPEADRLSYALDLMGFYLDPVPAFFQGCSNLGLDLSVRDVRTLQALDRRRGRWVSPDALQSAALFDKASDQWGSIETVTQRVSAIRRAFTASAYPVAVELWSGVGYRLTAPDAFTFEGHAHA